MGILMQNNDIHNVRDEPIEANEMYSIITQENPEYNKEHLDEIEIYVDSLSNIPSEIIEDHASRLFYWMLAQKIAYKFHLLDTEKVDKLESMPFWSSDFTKEELEALRTNLEMFS